MTAFAFFLNFFGRTPHWFYVCAMVLDTAMICSWIWSP